MKHPGNQPKHPLLMLSYELFKRAFVALLRTLHKGALPPPDYVGAWLDFNAIRVSSR